jgi:hypothetical protein
VKRLVVEEDAEMELAESATYYEQRRAGLGLEFEAAIREALSTIRQTPERSPLRMDGTRGHVMRRFPFIIHYLIKPEYVWIVVFAHASRKPGYWRRRLGGG